MMKLRIEEAISRARRQTGVKVLKKDLAAMLWPHSMESAQQVNMTNLINGNTATIRPEWVPLICEVCGCTADYLFGLDE